MVATFDGTGMLAKPYAMTAGYGAVPVAGSVMVASKEADFPAAVEVMYIVFELAHTAVTLSGFGGSVPSS